MRPEVDVQFRLEKQLTRIDIVQTKESRLKLAIDNEAEDAAEVCLFKLSIVVFPIEPSHSHCKSGRCGFNSRQWTFLEVFDSQLLVHQ